MDQSKKRLQLEIVRLKNELNGYKSNTSDIILPYWDMLSFLDDFNIGYLQFNREFIITRMNKSVVNLLGEKEDQLLGKVLFDTQWNILTERYKALTEEDILQFLGKLNNQQSENILMVVNRTNNIYRWIRVCIKSTEKLETGAGSEFGAVIQDVNLQKKNELEFKQQLRQKTILTHILARLSKIDIKNIDKEVNDALRRIGELMMVDHSYIFLFKPDFNTFFCAQEWNKKGSFKSFKKQKTIFTDAFPWCMKKLKKNEIICFNHIREMPVEANAEKKKLETQTILSILVVPIIESGRFIGFLGVDSKKYPKIWSNSEIHLLRTVTSVLGNIFENNIGNYPITEYNDKLGQEIYKHFQKKKSRRRSTAFNNSIVEATEAIVFSASSDGLIETFNPAAEKKLGYSASETIGRMSADKLIDARDFSPGVVPFIQNINQHCVSNKDTAYLTMGENYQYSIECNFKSKNGKRIPVLLQLNTIKGDDNKINKYIGVAIDFAEKKDKAFNLGINSLENIPPALVITDINGTVLYANKSYQKLTGYSYSELVGNKERCLRSPEFINSWLYKSIVDSCMSCQTWKGELVRKKKDGNIIFAETTITPVKNSNNEIVNFIAISADITEKKNGEKESKISEKFSLIQRELGFVLAKVTSLSVALDIIVKTVLKVKKGFAVGIHLLNRDTKVYDLMLANGFPDEYIQKSRYYTKGNSAYESISRGEVKFDNCVGLSEESDIKTIGVFPVKYGKNILGALSIGSKDTSFKQEEKIAISVLSAQIGAVLLRIITQDELFKSKENFQLLFDSSSDLIFILDESGCIIRTNPVAAKLLGYTREELEKLSASDIRPPDKGNEIILFIKDVLTGKRDTCHIPLCSKEGRLIQVESKMVKGEWDGKNAIFCISRDITERQKAQDLLRKSEARWQFVLESVGDGIWDWDIKTKRVHYSAHWKKMLEYSDENKLDSIKNWKSIVHPDDFQKLQEDMESHLKRQTPVFKNEHRLLCNNGEYKWILNRGKIISYDAEGNPERVIGTHTDISVPKKYQLSLLNSLNKEKELNELKTRFVSMTSHEFRTPLSTMLLKTDALEAYWEKMSPKDRVKKIHQIRGNVKFLSEIVEKVLGLSHLDSGKMKYQPIITNMNELILSIVDEYLARPEMEHFITYTSINEQINLMLDKQMITQAFNNLLDNAVKYSNPGTHISIKSYNVGNRLNIEITDQGIGISEQDAKTIWEPFIRGSNVENIQGTGLGLALTKQIIKIHGGGLELKSKLNEGTTFTISLTVGQCL